MRWQFSAGQWELLTEALFPGHFGIAVYPSPIEVRAQGGSDVERDRIRAEASAELTRLGLLRAGRVEPDLAGAMGVLHRPARWVCSAWCPHDAPDRMARVVTAGTGRFGVRAVQHPDQPGAVLLETIAASDLAAAVVGTLPPHPPGRSPAVTVPVEAIRVGPAAPERNGVLVSASATPSGAERSVAAVAAILDQQHSRAGQIGAAVRDPSGRARRSGVLCWRDNPDGRYQVTVSRSPGEPDRLTVGPTDPQRLGGGVQRLLASVQPR